MRTGIVVIMMLFLQACAIFGPPTELDDTKGLSAERIYEKASERMTEKDYQKSVEYLKKLESRYPNSKYGAQAKLDMAYAYYKQQDAAQCVSSVERFIKIHPNHPIHRARRILSGQHSDPRARDQFRATTLFPMSTQRHLMIF